MSGKGVTKPVVTVATIGTTSPGHGSSPPIRNCSVSPILPPSYDEAGPSNSAPPPSYNNLYGRNKKVSKWNIIQKIAKMQEQSKTDGEFNEKLIRTMCNSVVATVIFILYIFASIGGVIIGSIYLKECKENTIPTTLVTHGVFALLLTIKWSVENVVMQKRDTSAAQTKKPPDLVIMIQWILVIATLISGIYGSIATYGVVERRSSNPSSKDYCHCVIFHYAFTMFLVFDILVLSFIIACLGISWGAWLYRNSAKET